MAQDKPNEARPRNPMARMRAARLAPSPANSPTEQSSVGEQQTVSLPTLAQDQIAAISQSSPEQQPTLQMPAFTHSEATDAQDLVTQQTVQLPALANAPEVVQPEQSPAPATRPLGENIASQQTVQMPVIVRTPTPPRSTLEMSPTLHMPALSAAADSPAAQSPVPRSRFSVLGRVIGIGLARLQEPQPEGPVTRGLWAVQPEITLGLFPLLCLTNAFGLSLVSISYYLGQYGNFALEMTFLLGLLVVFVPNVLRLLSSTPTRFERICLLSTLGLAFYVLALMENPLHIGSFDGFLHWVTADNLLRTGHLFSDNSLLPVSPYYPGLEIITNAISSLTGLSTFYAGIPIVAAARLLMVLALFLFYEKITSSSRMAGIATLIYMANPHFIFFDAIYNYETLALPLAICALYILARYENIDGEHRWLIFTSWIMLFALTFTHHMTDYVFNGLLLLWAAVSFFSASGRKTSIRLVTMAVFGLVLALAYAFLVQGNPVWNYLSSYFNTAFVELGHIITGTGASRALFAGGGTSSPIWDRLLMTGSVALVAFALPFGLLTLWRLHRQHALPVMLGIFALAYPVAQAFRFTPFGSEIADRSTAFIFLAIAYVLTILITHFWPTRTLSKKAISLVTCAISVVLLGGAILDVGAGYTSLPGPYVVGADGRSVEPEGIDAALWAAAHLGPGHRVATDRTNQLLMGTYGTQHVITELGDFLDVSPLFTSLQFSQADQALLRVGNIHYLVVDLRLSSAVPNLGFYFVSDEPGANHIKTPISRDALTKFTLVPQLNRLFDSGNIVIYDTGAFMNQPGS